MTTPHFEAQMHCITFQNTVTFIYKFQYHVTYEALVALLMNSAVSDTICHVIWQMLTEVSEECITSIIRVHNLAMQAAMLPVWFTAVS
jgi:hypothetical protein